MKLCDGKEGIRFFNLIKWLFVIALFHAALFMIACCMFYPMLSPKADDTAGLHQLLLGVLLFISCVIFLFLYKKGRLKTTYQVFLCFSSLFTLAALLSLVIITINVYSR